MTQCCEICGQVKPCIRRLYLYPRRHFEINCDECHKKHCEEVKNVTDRAIIEELSSSLSVVGECGEEECELLNRAEQFLKDSVK